MSSNGIRPVVRIAVGSIRVFLGGSMVISVNIRVKELIFYVQVSNGVGSMVIFIPAYAQLATEQNRHRNFINEVPFHSYSRNFNIISSSRSTGEQNLCESDSSRTMRDIRSCSFFRQCGFEYC